MDADLTNRLIYELKYLNHKKQTLEERLSILDPYRTITLKRIQNNKGNTYYAIKPEGSSHFKYIGKEDDLRVGRIKEVAHLERSIDQIDNNIELVNTLLEEYAPYDFKSVDPLLPKAYQSETLNFSISAYQEAGRKWRTEKLIHQSHFPENHSERKTRRTSDGTMVKSTSEALIYDRFLDEGFFQIYELPLVLDDYGPPLYPDFTILSPIDLKTEIIVEHVGRLDDLLYSEGFAKRVYRYIRNGYIPGVNLFFTFCDKDGNIDSLQITKVITDILGIR